MLTNLYEGILGDLVEYEVIYDDGQVGMITTFVTEFDLKFPSTTNVKIEL